MSTTATRLDEELYFELIGEIEDYKTETNLSYEFTDKDVMFEVFENALFYSISVEAWVEGHFIHPKNRFELFVEDSFGVSEKIVRMPDITGVIDFSKVQRMKLYLPSEIGYDFFRIEFKYVSKDKEFFSVFDFYI